VYTSPFDIKETRQFKTKSEEFHKGEWRQRQSNVYVTMETVIPEMPTEKFEKPNEAAFRKRLSELEEKVKAIRSGLEERKEKFQETLQKKQSTFKDLN
jgi:hypothetical protein